MSFNNFTKINPKTILNLLQMRQFNLIDSNFSHSHCHLEFPFPLTLTGLKNISRKDNGKRHIWLHFLCEIGLTMFALADQIKSDPEPNQTKGWCSLKHTLIGIDIGGDCHLCEQSWTAKGCSPQEHSRRSWPRRNRNTTSTRTRTGSSRLCKRVRAEQKTKNKKMCTLRNLCANFSMTLKRCRRVNRPKSWLIDRGLARPARPVIIIAR